MKTAYEYVKVKKNGFKEIYQGNTTENNVNIAISAYYICKYIQLLKP